MTDESLTDGGKALHLIAKGFPLQKSTVLLNLYQLSTEREFTAVLEVVEREVLSWDEALQESAGSGVQHLLDSCTLQGNWADRLLKVCLALLATWSHAVHEAWVPVFARLVRKVSGERVRAACAQVLALGEPSQSIPTRAVAGRMLAILAQVLTAEFRGELITRTLSLSQDPSFDIRKTMCTCLPPIIHAVDEQYREKLLEEVVKLARDDDMKVRKAAIRALGQVIHSFPVDELERTVAPLFVDEVLTEEDLKPAVGSCIGEFLLALGKLPEKSYLSAVFQFCKEVQQEDTELQVAAITAIPQLLSVFYTPDTSESLFTYIDNYWSSDDLSVRESLSAVAHEVRTSQVLAVYGPVLPTAESLFLEMLQDSYTCWAAVPHLSVSFPLLSPAGKTEALKSMKTKLIGTPQWRKVVLLLQQLPALAKHWKVSEAIEHIQPAVMTLLQDSAWQLRLQCVESAVLLIHCNYYKSKRLALCSSITAFASSKYRSRVIFIVFCSKVVEQVSKATFEGLFFPLLIALATDPVSSVRKHLAEALPGVGRYFTGEEGWSKQIADTVSRLAEDEDKEVVASALNAQRVMSDHRYWASSRAVEIEDAEKVRYENLLDQTERRVFATQEQEESKKAFMQELTRQARLDYQEQRKASSRRSTSRSKPSSNRTTPTRVKKRSSMSQEKVPSNTPVPPAVRPFLSRLPIGRSDVRPSKKK